MSITTLRDEVRAMKRMSVSMDMTSESNIAVFQTAQLGRIVEGLDQLNTSIGLCNESLREIGMRLRCMENSDG